MFIDNHYDDDWSSQFVLTESSRSADIESNEGFWVFAADSCVKVSYSEYLGKVIFKKLSDRSK